MMQIRHLKISRFRGIRELAFEPGPATLIIGPNNAGKSAVLEALDLLLHSGLGRPRPSPTEVDYYGRDVSQEFSVEATLGDLPPSFMPEVRQQLEGWKAETGELVPEPDGDGIEPVVRIRVRGTVDFEVVHEFAKEEAAGSRFSPRLRSEIGWVFDGRTRDPTKQLAFYQGGLLERLFGDIDLDPALETLREALGDGAGSVNAEVGVQGKLADLGGDLRGIGLLREAEQPEFEVGAVSERGLLQSLRLALPGEDVVIPLFRQGRGAQRLLLVAVLLRLTQAAGRPAIAGFEEPEEALEPLRQTQVARMLGQIVDGGGQVFVVTHSPEIARAFFIEDFLLLDERAGGEGARSLREALSEPVRQKYERRLDGSVVRALFARVPLLVEGPGDRAVLDVFWRHLAGPATEAEPGVDPVRPREQIGVEIVNCEGAHELPMMSRLLREAGKSVGVWAEQDVPDVLEKLRAGGHVDALLLHEPSDGRRNLEEALAQGASLEALEAALAELANSRGYSWGEQRGFLVSAAEGIDQAQREAMKTADSLEAAFEPLAEPEARALITRALSAKAVTPFEMKGGRQGRIVAETILEVDDDVPPSFARVIRGLDQWIRADCPAGTEIAMAE